MNRTNGKPKLFSDFGQSIGRIKTSNLRDLIFREFSVPIFCTHCLAFFTYHVSAIFGFSSKEKVGRVAALAIIAPVKNAQVIENLSKSHFPSDLVCSSVSRFKCQLSVAMSFANGSHPVPARGFAVGFINSGPEVFFCASVSLVKAWLGTIFSFFGNTQVTIKLALANWTSEQNLSKGFIRHLNPFVIRLFRVDLAANTALSARTLPLLERGFKWFQ